MATGKSNKWLWIVGGAILLAGGIGAYFLLRKKGDEEEVIEGTEEIKQQEPTRKVDALLHWRRGLEMEERDDKGIKSSSP
jgi:LPXTG-motif cell wall-anchored protein